MQFALIVKGLKINSGRGGGGRDTQSSHSQSLQCSIGSKVRGEKIGGKVA